MLIKNENIQDSSSSPDPEPVNPDDACLVNDIGNNSVATNLLTSTDSNRLQKTKKLDNLDNHNKNLASSNSCFDNDNHHHHEQQLQQQQQQQQKLDVVRESDCNQDNSTQKENNQSYISPISKHQCTFLKSSDVNKTATETKDDSEKNNTQNSDCHKYVTIIHFNDCYNIESGPQSSGAAGFLTAIKQHRHLNPMILFSGDILSPSFMSTFTKGEQMIPVLNDIKVDCAVFGNHEFDYGVDNLIDFVKKTTFPWLLSNVIDKETSNQLGDGEIFHIIERDGFRFGLIGLIEEEWLSTLSTLDSSDVIYQDFVERGQELARWLKSEPHNVDYVIALTHFRTPNDIRLSDSVPEIDLVLGGHDHDYEIIKRQNSYIIKSGTDFREFSKIKLMINPEYAVSKKTNSRQDPGQVKPFTNIDIERVKCVGYEPDAELKSKLDKFVTTIDEKMGKVLGQFNCELDGRFSSIRKFETNLGNFVTDIMLASTHADMAILNSGTLRSDRIHPRGDFTMRDLFNILGYIDPIAVLSANGRQIWKALENGVSQWPKLEGRFPQISGCSFTFDPSKPSLHRIDPKNIVIGDEPIDLDKYYRLTTKAYLASGKDGYDVLKECEILVPGDETPDLTTSILNHFEAINIVKSNRRTHHRQSIICLSRMSLQKILDNQEQYNDSHNGLQETEDLGINTSVSGSQLTSSSTTSNITLNSSNTPHRRIQHNYNCSYEHQINDGTFLVIHEQGGGGNMMKESNDNSQLSYRSSDETNNNNIAVTDETFDLVRENSDSFAQELASKADSVVGNNVNCKNLTNHLATSSPLVGSVAPEYNCPTTPNTSICSNHSKTRTKRLMSLYEMEHEQCKLEPKVEGRIRILGVNF